jgi:hypothetical protein
MVKNLFCFIFFVFFISTTPCNDFDTLHGVWLTEGIYSSWQNGVDTENFGTKIITLERKKYESIWLNLVLNLKATPRYFKYWETQCFIDDIKQTGRVIQLKVHSEYHREAKGIFNIELLDENSFRMTIVTIDDDLSTDLDNACFTPDKLYPEQIYIRCPEKQNGLN